MSFIRGKRFTFFDVETPNRHNDKISSIGISTINEFGEERSYYYLVNPEDSFDDYNMKLTGITPKMVEKAPNFEALWDEIKQSFTNAIVVAHNAVFDLSVLNKCFDRYNIEKPEIYYICTLKLSQSLLDFRSFKLNDLCSSFGIDLMQHHSADCDARACMEIFKELDKRYELNSDIVKLYVPKKYSVKIDGSTRTKAYNSLYGILKGIYFDDVFKENEIAALKKWLEEYANCKGDEDFGRVYDLLKSALSDNLFEYNEYIQIFNVLKKIQTKTNYNDATIAMQILFGILRGIIADKKINQLELVRLEEWVNNNVFLRGNYPYDTIYAMIKKVLEDGVIDEEEHKMLLEAFDNFVNPKKEICCSIEFIGKTFCLTGNFESGTKSDVEEKIKEKGGIVSKSVIKKTNYVVVGGSGSEAYKFGNYGSKVNKALELQEKGSNIKIISEETLLELIETAC